MENEAKAVVVEPDRPVTVPLVHPRISQANTVLCQACAECGVRVFSWQQFDAWDDYVECRIDEPQLTKEARKELERYSESYGKYLIMDKENPVAANEEIEKRKRAKRAAKIYSTLCQDAGLTLCFFNDFSTWSGYVQGKIKEEELLDKVRMEVSSMLQDAEP